MTEAVRSVLTQYMTFTGRAGRSEFWYWQLALMLLSIPFAVAAWLFGSGAIGSAILLVYWVISIAVIIPALAVAVRRMHDTDRSGWWLLVGFIPFIGWILLVVLMAQPSDPGSNQYGARPA